MQASTGCWTRWARTWPRRCGRWTASRRCSRAGRTPVTDFGERLVSRSDIARMAGVKRPAVTNWERRHTDFPTPVAPESGGPEPEAFRAGDVLTWLSGRTIPANALQPGEPAGTTYGDRFRAGLRGNRSGSLLSAVEQLAGRDAARFAGRLRMPDYLNLLLSLVFFQSHEDKRWARYVEDPAVALVDPDLDLPVEYDRLSLADVIRFLDRNPPASRDESRQAFDRLLSLLRDADARAADEFFTPPSVSRVMARSLAAQGPPARRLYDPFCRSGELLCAYLDAIAERGGDAPEEITGREPRKAALRLARMNVLLHGGRRPRLAPGPVRPEGDPPDPPGMFDAVLTNPPFGGGNVIVVGEEKPREPWHYARTHSPQFDWLQYVLSRLAPGGRAAVLMPSGASFQGGAERHVRAYLLENGALDCVMALPSQLFERTRIQTQIWFLRPPRGRAEQVLFVDGAGLGHMASRYRRSLSDDDVDRLVRAYASWHEARDSGRDHAGIPGLSRAVRPEEIVALDYRMDPPLLVHGDAPMEAADRDATTARDRLARLSKELGRLSARARAADSAVEERLRRYGL
ncbi:N-6 DNA methylase [Streptomyces ipomoeae]|uniref:N-6 DNA methylase n=1 Tax=Streptomyces ipomoeae TaxID=103232 RepID=A0AAE8VT31_9ACTN|nr:N-6 DNA methylase [Streptomyces ipomoeae]TQE35679.1 N-6 DNA methylase [Streptomyces ipomoeae]